MLNSISNLSNKLIDKWKPCHNIFAVEIKSTHGLGAKLVWVLEILAFCEENKLTPNFKFTYPDSNEDEDYFKNFFDIKTYNHIHSLCDFTQIGTIGELGLNKNYNSILDTKLTSYLINKYLSIKDDVVHEVDEFYSKYFSNKKVLGIHYRGTDKFSEAPLVSYDKVERNINYYLEKFPETDSIFISSDDSNFIEYIENCSIRCSIIYRNDVYRSSDKKSIHGSNKNKYDINRDAIVNCLILSRCDCLMKTASILSAWSKLFNPKLPLIMINKPFEECTWFPESELLDNVLYDSVE